MARDRMIEDEHVVLRTRTHGKALFWPAVGLIVAGAMVGAGAALIPHEYRPVGQYVVAGLGLVLALLWSVRPFLRWFSTTFTLTNFRLTTKTGILHRTSKALPLTRVADVAFDQSLSDRMFRCGTITLQTAADGGVIVLSDVPDVQHVHSELTAVVFGGSDHVDHEPSWPRG